MRFFSSKRAVASCAALCLCFCSILGAQAISGDITGLVTDATGAVVKGATIAVQNDATGIQATATTNDEGTYRLSNLPIGTYTVSATMSGFAKSTLKNLQVALNNVVTANLTLNVSSNATTVEVSAAGANIDTTTAQLQTTFSARQTAELPLAGRGTGIWNLTLAGAGVSSSGGVGQGTGPAVSGQRPDNNFFSLDGVSNNNHYNPGPLVYTSNEAVAEVSLLQNQFSPEFGGGSGGVFNAVVKTGTNAVHGSLYEYMQNRNLNAVDALDAVAGLRSLPRYDNNRLGATVGGPILKNKFFYFGNFEYNPIGQSAVPGSPLTAPTADGVATLSALADLSATNLSVFKQFVPTAAVATGSLSVLGATIPTGPISVISPSHQNNYNAIVALDYNISDKDQLRGRWVYNHSQGIDTSAQLPAFDVTTPNNNYLYSISEFHNFSPTLQNEFRASFSRNFNELGVPNYRFGNLDAFPNITIDELNNLNIGPSGPSGSIQNLAQFSDNISKVAGKHTLKFGYNFIDVILTNYFIQRVRGDYEYQTLEQFLEDLSPGTFGERSAGPTSYPAGFLQHGAYANDDFRILPNLTLNLGVRYEKVTMPVASRYQSASTPASVPGVFEIGEPHFSNNDWSPRIGLAYSPGKSGVWSIRGGFSRAFDLTYANLTSNAAPPYFQQTNDVQDYVNQTPNFLASGGLSGAPQPLPMDQQAAMALVTSYTYSKNRPYGITWTGGVQRVFKKDYTLEVRYTGTRGVHLWNQTRQNIYPQVNASNYIPTYLTMPSAGTLAGLTKTLGDVQSYIVPGGTADYPDNALAQYGSVTGIVGFAPQSTSTYHGLAVQLSKRYSNGLSFIAAYTWSHLLDNSTATNFSTYLTPRRAQDFQDLRSEWASSALDRRHRFTFTPIYDWKPFASRNWFLKNVVGNWNISGTYTYQSPEYATVQSGVDSNLNGDSAADRAIVNPTGARNTGTGVTAYNSAGQVVAAGDAATVAYVANNPNARYVVASYGALANGGRNTFPLHPTDTIDAGLNKRFNINERMQFTIGAQVFNLLNHAQFTGGYTNDVASLGYTGSRNDLLPDNSLFGRFDQFYSSNSRTMQIVAHFIF